MSFEWSEQRTEYLRQRWKAGASASTIARELGGGLTRNAVVGKAHRLGLAGRASPIKRDRTVPAAQRNARETIKRQWAASRAAGERKAAAMAKAPDQKPAPAPAPKPAPTPPQPLVQRVNGRTCCWPIGHPREPGFHFCGHPDVVVERPYCVAHCNIAYKPPGHQHARAAE